MQGTFIGFNTAGITFEDRFLALLLKNKAAKWPLSAILSTSAHTTRSSSHTSKSSACDV